MYVCMIEKCYSNLFWIWNKRLHHYYYITFGKLFLILTATTEKFDCATMCLYAYIIVCQEISQVIFFNLDKHQGHYATINSLNTAVNVQFYPLSFFADLRNTKNNSFQVHMPFIVKATNWLHQFWRTYKAYKEYLSLAYSVKIDLNKKLDLKKNTIQTFTIDAQSFIKKMKILQHGK